MQICTISSVNLDHHTVSFLHETTSNLTCFRCECGKCSSDNLAGAREHRCCWEVPQAIGKLTFEGLAEELRCVTNHPDFDALTNKAVLTLAGPLFKTREGKHYKRGNRSENE